MNRASSQGRRGDKGWGWMAQAERQSSPCMERGQGGGVGDGNRGERRSRPSLGLTILKFSPVSIGPCLSPRQAVSHTT